MVHLEYWKSTVVYVHTKGFVVWADVRLYDICSSNRNRSRNSVFIRGNGGLSEIFTIIMSSKETDNEDSEISGLTYLAL